MNPGKWSARFLWASVIQGLFAVIWTLFIVNPWSTPSPSKIIAAGSAGTWFFTGYVLYVLVGVVAIAVTSFFYIYIEGLRGKAYSGISNYLAWGHLLLMNIGVAASTWLLMYGGYSAGAALLPASQGGLGWNATQVHVNILQYYVNPVGILVWITALGALLGGLGYVLTSRKA